MRKGHLRNILHPASSVPAALSAMPALDIRRRPDRIRLHHPARTGGDGRREPAASPSLPRRGKHGLFLRFPIGGAFRMPYISPAGTFGQRQLADINRHRRGNREPMAKKKATTKKAAPKKATKAAKA